MQPNRPEDLTDRLHRTTQYIATTQNSDGSIPWFENSIVDPWDHVEAAMGLAIGGETDRAADAYRWLAKVQREDGSWLAAYRNGVPFDATRAETNFVAYIATGVWHQYLITRDHDFVAQLWPTIEAALAFVLDLQTEHGEIYWAVDTIKGVDRDALITGCSSIYRSLAAAADLATLLGHDAARYTSARARLGQAIRTKPERFDRTWASKARYSMDWFYPVLTGVFVGTAATDRLNSRWSEFIEPGVGCRCVMDEPWITIAETCELCMALCAAGDKNRAHSLFTDLARFQYQDGSWWTGFVTRDQTLWPDERPTWTAAAVLLAADALYQLTPANRLFADYPSVERNDRASELTSS